MFERFTDRGRRVIVQAQQEARALGHNYIGTEHLLLGLLHDAEGKAFRALQALNISAEAVREQVEETVGRGQRSPAGPIPFTPRAKKVLEHSLREALQLHHHYIGTEHIVLALIREGEGVAAQVLSRLGADLQHARAVVARLSPPAEVEQQLHPLQPPIRLATRAEILDALSAIHDRLAAIETHLGIARGDAGAAEGAGGAGPATAEQPSPAAARPRAGGRPSPRAGAGPRGRSVLRSRPAERGGPGPAGESGPSGRPGARGESGSPSEPAPGGESRTGTESGLAEPGA